MYTVDQEDFAKLYFNLARLIFITWPLLYIVGIAQSNYVQIYFSPPAQPAKIPQSTIF